jgi:hypothetical protein
MSQKNLDILGNNSIGPFLVEPEYSEFIPAVDPPIPSGEPESSKFIPSVEPESSKFIPSVEPEYSEFVPPVESEYSEFIPPVESEYSEFIPAIDPLLPPVDPEYPGFNPEVDPNARVNSKPSVDPLTGIERDFTDKNRVKDSTITNAGLQITLFGGTSMAMVTATVKVELSPYVKFLIREDLVDILLQSTVWGIDGNLLNGGDDHLFNFSNQTITRDGTYTFSKYVPRRWLNEDHSWFNNDDEIAASISLASSDSAFPLNKRIMTNMVRGTF